MWGPSAAFLAIPKAHALLLLLLLLQESIRNASRRLTDLELLKPRCVTVLGHDPTAAVPPPAVSGAAQLCGLPLPQCSCCRPPT